MPLNHTPSLHLSRRISPALLHLSVAGGLAYLFVFLGVAALRLVYPFEVEWMEGGMITHAARLLEGQPIYAAPSADFVPFFYTPGYPTVLSWLSPLFGGLSFTLARGVSLASTLFTFGLLFRIGQREANWRYGLLAAGIYAALFRTNGAFYDLARPDALFMALLLSAVYVAYTRPTWRGAIAAACLFVLGFFTKQTVSVFVPAVGIYLLWRNWRHGLLFLVAAFGLAAVGARAYNDTTGGWFWTFVFEGHQGHLFYWKNILMEYWRDVLFVAPLLLLLPLLWFGYKVPVRALSVALAAWWSYAIVFRARTLDYVPHMYYRELWYETPRWQILVPPLLIATLLLGYRALNRTAAVRPRTDAFWLLMFVAGVGASGLNHSTQWAYSNCFMLLSAFAAILVALGTRDLLEPSEDGRTPRWSALVPAAILVQLVAWIYSPAEQVPNDADYAALARLDMRLASIDGPIFMPAHPLYSYLRDGQIHVHQMGIQDVAFMGGLKDLRHQLRKKRWAAVVVDERNRVPGLSPNYYVGDRLSFKDPDALKNKTGFRVRPHTIWYAQDPSERLLSAGVTGNFEGGTYLGWTATGDAFAERPGRRCGAGRQGRRCAASSRSGRGRLLSAPFTITQPRLTYLMAGSGGRKVSVRVKVGGRVVSQRHGPRQRRLKARRFEFDLSGYMGAQATVEVVDTDAQHTIVIDDLRLMP